MDNKSGGTSSDVSAVADKNTSGETTAKIDIVAPNRCAIDLPAEILRCLGAEDYNKHLENAIREGDMKKASLLKDWGADYFEFTSISHPERAELVKRLFDAFPEEAGRKELIESATKV